MPNHVFLLIIAAVTLLALFDVGLGHLRHDPYTGGRRTVRIGLREFLTRPLPIFLFGVGTAMLPDRTWAGAGLLLLAAVLGLLGCRAKCPSDSVADTSDNTGPK